MPIPRPARSLTPFARHGLRPVGRCRTYRGFVFAIAHVRGGGELGAQRLLGLVMRIVSDFTYTLVDPRIDFESRG